MTAISTPSIFPSTAIGPGSAPRPRYVLIAFGSRFGNTQRLAEALGRGLERSPGVEVNCRSVEEVPLGELVRCDLLVVGGPTEMFSASKPMKSFLERLPAGELRGKEGFAFDTKLEGRLAGSAARYIEKHLERLGVHLVRPHASVIVRSMTKEERAEHGEEGAPDWVRKLEHKDDAPTPRTTSTLDLLTPGAEDEFERIGAELGAALRLVAR